MPPLDDNIEDLDSSSDPNLDAKPATDDKPAEQATDAKSSDATGETDDSLLNVVRDAVKPEQEKSQAASPAEGDEEQEDGEKPRKSDDEEYSDVPFHKHPRFQHLLRKSKALEVEAVRARNVDKFLDDAGLTPQEAANGLTIMAMAKTDPAGAWKQLKPFVQNLLVAAGEVLPDDLKKRVSANEMTAEAALELSRARAAQESTQAAQSFREQQASRRQQVEAANSLRSAAETWEQNRRARDPNFDAKYQSLMKEVAYLHATEGRPDTPEKVKEQLKRAYDAVNTAYTPAPAAPARRPAIRPINGGQVAQVRSEPQSVLDIVRANRRTA